MSSVLDQYRPSHQYVWDADLLIWVAQESSGGGVGAEVQVTNFPASQAVTGPLTDAQLRATPVPVEATIDTTGLATDTGQDTGNASLDSIDTKLSSQATAAKQDTGNTTLASLLTELQGKADVGETQPVSGTFWQATQPVSGTFWQATQPVSGPLTDAQLRAVAVPVSGTFWQATQPVSGTVTANAGSGTMAVSGTFWQATQPVSGTFWQATQPVSGTFWQATQPVSIAATVAVKELRAATTTFSSVNDSATNVTILASNANRLGASIHNDSTVALYLKLGATATTSSYTVKMAADSHYEVPAGYTGIIDGIWASDAAGAARVTEISA